MSRDEISALVHSETESIAYSIQNEFLQPTGASAPVAAYGCVHLLLPIALRNNTTIGKIKNAILTGAKTKNAQEYRPDLIERVFLNRFIYQGHKKHKLRETDQRLFMAVCNEIISQQKIIRELDAYSLDVCNSGTKISFCLKGLIKISIPGILYLMIIQQKIGFMAARHMLLVNRLSPVRS